ncbi:MAG: sigma-70 family RNA polymerase sigma factor [Chitinivibrionales bacterium]|nr:sigma-70 family RNA polymerase sigma factor [Chitinivibrionales bacterium]
MLYSHRFRRELLAVQTDVSKWVDRYGDILYRYALARVNDTDVAQDLVQDTFMAALKAIDNFAGKAQEKTWLIGILKHKIIDYYRKKSSQMEKSTESAPDVDAFFDEKGRWAIPVNSWDGDPDRVLSNRQFFATLHECMDQLPKNQFLVFKFREMMTFSIEELCNILNLTATNVSVLLYRARQALRKCIDSNWFERT